MLRSLNVHTPRRTTTDGDAVASLIKMHEAQAEFLEQLVEDSTTVEETQKIKIIRHPTSSLQ